MIETSGVRRSWLTEDSSAGAQALGLGQQPRLLDVGGQLRALDRDRDLVDQRIEKATLLGVERTGCRSNETPSRPCVLLRRSCSGRNSQVAAGSVAELHPAGSPCSQAHSAAPQSRGVELILRRIAAGDRQRPCPDRGVSTSEAHCSVEAT